MTIRDRLAGSGVSRRDMIRIGAGGLGFGLFGGVGPVPFLFGQGESGGGAGVVVQNPRGVRVVRRQ